MGSRKSKKKTSKTHKSSAITSANHAPQQLTPETGAALFEDARSRLETVFKALEIHPDAQARLMQPSLSLQVSVPVRMDDGSLKAFPAWRVQYDTSLGPAKGGVRFHPDVNQHEVTTLSFWMAVKCAVVGLPYGGGKGGVQVDAKALSSLERERLARGYIRAIADIMGPDRDIPAPDVNTDATVMGWMIDEYEQIRRAQAPAAITGKPLSLGGSPGRVEATGRGALTVLDLWAEREERTPEETTLAVQGFGNAAFHFARLASQRGYKVVAVSDSSGAIYHADGLDIDAAKEDKQQHGKLSKSQQGKAMSGDELLGLEVDVLVLAALENQLHRDNVDEVKAGAVLEIANGPLTSEADTALEKRDIPVLPDVLANTGGVIVSYFEWLQNRAGEKWHESEVNQRLDDRLGDEAKRVLLRAEKEQVTYRQAAYRQGIERIAEAIMARGNCQDCR
ncbi:MULTISPECIES: Glu/Leu/Phe/Val dehydrogenase [unclassified Halomonas]|jgi:glutamate dehydrogenase (NADP+)|uniref:Glu/Leu/Phe/Val family dehydrogenase n=1 Tax=Halomonadaceae TaxID=28256 RepID=UPI001EF6CE5E|nr:MULTISPECIES: Glu/Leu/Phe/Val dehydrogenase [unclassified Halomonas]MCG7577496.1 Glu/Leu/Phe/Val dehydrogenase [Halomonas sp. MMH1-48]MCG7592157.1 Glu/Leu/Phe/Val dehydrogenase [Halomonas sp. McD50-5]MCG7604633.1 Glu/Leu/Phe/Val dehydrogenase [Halomonas sp. MM17-34]MCG7613695.1 Glu/Leu/Phe/Val dehydrogenase [Halomonas sp. MM17-29]MCG7618208.1 Glu/Leu/Phe/Val dehydrogenase [Halomonas sp. McD50-4]